VTIVAEIKAAEHILSDILEIESGPVSISVSGPLRILIVASNGKQILDTTLQINIPAGAPPKPDTPVVPVVPPASNPAKWPT